MSIGVYKSNINAIKTLTWSLLRKLVNQARILIAILVSGHV